MLIKIELWRRTENNLNLNNASKPKINNEDHINSILIDFSSIYKSKSINKIVGALNKETNKNISEKIKVSSINAYCK